MMSNRSRDDFDRLMTSWMEAEGRVPAPEALLGRALERSRAARRRPRWLLTDWWFPMQNVARWQAVWRPAPLVLLVVALALVAALVVIVAGGSRQKVPAPFGLAGNGAIAYDTNGSIFVANGDGSAVRVLVGSVANAAAPAFSPDGRRLAFWGDGSPDSLYVADANGANLRRLVADLWIATDKSPTWSPDSRHLAFSTETGPDRQDERILVVDVDTGATTTIDGGRAYGRRLVVPSWSADGQWLVATVLDIPDARTRLWIVRPDGSDGRFLVTSPVVQSPVGARWAPIPTRHAIAYEAVSAVRQSFVAIYDIDSGVETRISDAASEPAFWPAWSPDGSRVAWLGGANLSLLFIARPDGQTAISSVAAGGIGRPPAWSPHGARIVGLTDSRTGVVVVTLDGSAPPIRIPHPASQGRPDWQRLALP